MTLTKPPIDSPHTVNLLPTLRFSPEWKALYWITVTALLIARVIFFGFTFFDEGAELESPWFIFIPVIALHSLYIIALPIAAYAKSAGMIRFALYAFAGSMIMPFLFSGEHFFAFFVGGIWSNLPPIMLILSAPLVLLYSNSAIIHKHRQALQKTFRLVAIITLLSTVVYLFLYPTVVVILDAPPFIETEGTGTETSNFFSDLLFSNFFSDFFSNFFSNLLSVYLYSVISIIFNFLFGGFGHVPLLAMVIVWRYLDTNRFNSILRIFTTAATIAVLGAGYSVLSIYFFSFDFPVFFSFAIPGLISIFFITMVALRSITTVHPFISPFGYPIFKVLGPKPMPHDPNKPTLGAKILADYRDKSLFHLDENEEPQKS